MELHAPQSSAPHQTAFGYPSFSNCIFVAIRQLQIYLIGTQGLHNRRRFLVWPIFFVLQARLSATPADVIKH